MYNFIVISSFLLNLGVDSARHNLYNTIIGDAVVLNRIIHELKVRIYDMIYFELRRNNMYAKKHTFNSLQVIDAGLIEVNGGWRHKRRFLEHYELLFVTKGTIYIWVSGQAVALSKGQLLILAPYQMLDGSDTSREEVSFFWVDFFTDMSDLLSVCARTVFQRERIVTLLKMLLEALPAKNVNSDIPASILLIVLNIVKSDCVGETRLKTILQKTLAFVETHLSDPLTATSVAKALHYNKDYICRVLFKSTGMTLKQYINCRKLELSRTLLRTSAYSIEEIAGLLGFEDSNLFTKFFTYHQKVSPTAYRSGAE